MKERSRRKPSLVQYTADAWEHVCPLQRVGEPARQAGWTVIRGSRWENVSLQAVLEPIAQADLVVVQRDFPRHMDVYNQVVETARATNRPVIYEIDDLLVELPEQHPDYYHYLPARSAILRAVVEADAVVASTPVLCEYLTKFNPDVRVLPNYLNDQWWRLRPHRPTSERIVIGYMGGFSHVYDLDPVLPALIRILERHQERIQVKFWGTSPPPAIRGDANVYWLNPGLVSYRDFAVYFGEQDCDIFLAPLQDNPFNHCKSHLKYLEYSALAVPGVYSRVTPYENIVIPGENGFLAGEPEEWEDCLEQLIEDADLRRQIGQTAQDTVRENWLLSQNCFRWEDAYDRLVDSPEDHQPDRIRLNIVRQTSAWQREMEERIFQQNDRIKEQNQQIDSLRVQNAERHQFYHAVLRSKGWKAVERLYPLRFKIIPKGSRREAVARAGLQAASILKNEGPRSLLRFAIKKNPRWGGPAGESIANSADPIITNGLPVPSPAVSVVALAGSPAPDLSEVVAWVKKQTCSALVAVTIWDRETGRAFDMRDPASSWIATGAESLCQGLPGRYLCMASEDLLRGDELYLENNLIALETETLAFTVNLYGRADWAFAQVRQGHLPGCPEQPFLRQVVAKEAVSDGFSLNLSKWAGERRDFMNPAGKIIQHTTSHPDPDGAFPFDSHLSKSTTFGRRIFVRAQDGFPGVDGPQVLHSVTSVFPTASLPSEKPTVFVIMPFLAVGGAEQHALKVMNALKDKVRFVLLAFEELLPELGTTADAFREITPYVYNIPDYLHSALNSSFLENLIQRYNPACFYICNGTSWIYTALPEIKQRHPTIRILNQVYDHEVGWINRYDISLVLHLDGHVAVNEKIRDAYIQKGVKPEQIYLLEAGVDPREFDPALYPAARVAMLRKQFAIPDGKKVITFAGRIHPQKRPVDFIELARRFSGDDSLVFLMVGDGPQSAMVDGLAAKIGLKNLRRYPFYRPLSDVFAITDVFVLPSEFEGMPMVVMEAQAMGKPVVVTDAGNNREVIERTRGGIVTTIGDLSGLMSGVRRMLDEPPDPRQLRQTVLQHFDIAIAAERHRKAFFGLNDD